MDDLDAELVDLVAHRSRGRMELLAWAVSPDGRWAVVRLRVRESNAKLESLYERTEGGWVEWVTSNGSTVWSSIPKPDGTSIGVYRTYDVAPHDAAWARIQCQGAIKEVPILNGHFAFALFDVTDEELTELTESPPQVVGFLRGDRSRVV